ncbi:glutathionylspermidine synthase family protein [Caulobacter segnis]|uniref:glutathionylspermidine synthase family protein n=1 Tax=Caulobacter segnis TaxID=88688 RepID=UPI00240EB2DA|nr:glutathionylspermidine synthase family protein [Caulobacter segnis]MDG2520557.1 glutathionylspermidine synthase family protein [Caulobacter segnis]
MRRLPIEERADWRSAAEAIGFVFHHMDGRRYWDERAYYAFTLEQVETDLEPAAQTLHAMCLELVAEACASERLMERLAIPRMAWDLVAASFGADEPSLYGRFDFAYDGAGPPKLYEYNADTPTSVFEASVVQWLWLEDQIRARRLPAHADQFNSLHEKLVARLGGLVPPASTLTFTCVEDAVEDRQTVRYLEDAAAQAGLRTRFTDIARIGVDDHDRFVDAEDYVIQTLFKLYPWEDLFREPYAFNIAASGTRFIEPAWKAVLSNKAILPLLWERHPGHPNLLPAFFDDDPKAASLGVSFVRKPFFSREGANIELVEDGRGEAVLDQGYGAEGHVRQALHPLPRFDAGYPVIGAWMVGDEAAGIGVREDDLRVTQDRSRFVPHAIVD